MHYPPKPCHCASSRYPEPGQFKTHGGWFTTVALRAIASHPENVVVTETCLRSATILEVDCHPDDKETLVGDQRRISAALHTLLHTLGNREGEEYLLRTVTPLEIPAAEGPDTPEPDTDPGDE